MLLDIREGWSQQRRAGASTKQPVCATPSSQHRRLPALACPALPLTCTCRRLQAACSSALARGYDLVAVQPQTERLFQLACGSLEVDLISLDLSRRLPYRFKPSMVKAALARGLHFEVGGREQRGT